jgi:uncharacterized surface protein with fasciclin (FAS1) repeats
MRLTRIAVCRSLAASLFALALAVPAAALTSATVLDVAAQQKNLNTFVAAVHTAGLDDALRAAGPLTVYAPTDEAFAKLPAAERTALLGDPARLKAVLLGHIVNVAIRMRQDDSIVTSGLVPTAGGREIAFGVDGERTTVGAAHLLKADIQAGNGSINTIDKVLLP